MHILVAEHADFFSLVPLDIETTHAFLAPNSMQFGDVKFDVVEFFRSGLKGFQSLDSDDRLTFYRNIYIYTAICWKNSNVQSLTGT